VIDVGREAGIGLGIVEWLLHQDLFDGIRIRLDPAGPGQVFRERFADEVPERHATGSGGLGRPPMKVSR
jgi:hypothetical protein